MKRAFVGIVAAAAFASLAAADGDAKSYDIDWHNHWKAGQVATTTEHESSDTETTMNGAKLSSEHELLDATFVVRCDAVDASGDAAKRTVFFKSWKQMKKGQADQSLTGATIAVDGRTWKQSGGDVPGELAKKWLDNRYVKGSDDEPVRKIAPKSLTVGRPWKPDPKEAAKAFAAMLEDAPFDLAAIEMELTLVSAQGAPPDVAGRCEIKVRLPFSSTMPGMPPGAVLAPGSAADVVGFRTGPLTTATMLDTDHFDFTAHTNVEVPQQGRKIAVSTTMRIVTDSLTVAGGEIPAPAKADPPAPGGK